MKAMKANLDYWDLRWIVKNIIPRRLQLEPDLFEIGAIKEKGRKTNYYQYDLKGSKWEKNERLLNAEEVRGFVEISLRAAACPMPFNIDIWDGLRCGYGCQYCFADNFRASLYTSFFDNGKTMGMRHCNPDYYKRELDKLMECRGKAGSLSDIQKAVALNVPLRLGIRFEDFLPIEGKKGISLALLNYLAEIEYPVMINSKSNLLKEDRYIKALSSNKAGSAVHITLISSDNTILKKIEPGAPSYEERLKTMKALSSAGVRVVARIEPYMVFINDRKEDVEKYISDIKAAGVKHLTFDTYSYSANNPGIRNNFYKLGYDFERMFLLTTDSQPIGSLLLGKFMDLFRAEGLSCSTFDLGNVPDNDDAVCCCAVGDHFHGKAGFNHGSAVRAIRFIQSKKGRRVTWNEYEEWVEDQGGFLSDSLRKDMQRLWNMDGNGAFFIVWGKGIEPAGIDEGNSAWRFNNKNDFRMKVLEGVI